MNGKMIELRGYRLKIDSYLERITKYREESQPLLSSFDEAIVIFYFERNLKQRMESKLILHFYHSSIVLRCIKPKP